MKTRKESKVFSIVRIIAIAKKYIDENNLCKKKSVDDDSIQNLRQAKIK